MFFNEVVNAKYIGIWAILIVPAGQHYLAMTQLCFFYNTNTAEYEARIMSMSMGLDMDVQELLIMRDSNLLIRQA